MTRVDDLKSSKFLTKNDVEPAKWFTITKVEEMDVSMESQPQRMKMCLCFRETEKPLVLNVTNGRRIKTYYAKGEEEIEKWIGVKVKLWNDPEVEFAGELTGGIRVVIPQQQVENEPHPDITEDTNTYEEAKAAQESKFCGDCGKPKGECDCIPF